MKGLAFPLGLGVAHAILWFVANHREGVWRQVPATDQAHDLTSAWIMFQALVDGNISSLLAGWVTASPVHTPLVPFTSALLMLAFGESRIVAEAVLPLFTVIWLVATYLTLLRLYDRGTAQKATAIVGAFPVFLIYSRTYLFEHPLAAMFACACLVLLRTDRFLNTGASAMFGALAGLTALARGGGAVFLVGPVLVALVAAWHEPGRHQRLANCGLATLIGLGIAGTWYGPNFFSFAEYVFRATYGEDALSRTGGTGALSLYSASYYLTWLIAQGPGLPLLLVAMIACVSSLGGSHRPGVGRASLALAAVFAIDCALLLAVTQREGARYFQPLMPILAVAIVRSIQRARPQLVGRMCSVAAWFLACHHVLALYGFVREPPQAVAAYLGDAPLWDHMTYFDQLSPTGVTSADTDYKLPETIEHLGRLGLPSGARIATLSSPHPFFQPNGLQWQATRNRVDWRFVWSVSSDVDAILVRTGGPDGMELSALTRTLPFLFDASSGAFRARERLLLGDGSLVTIFVGGP